VTKGEELQKEIKNAGVSIVFLADRMKCSRNRIYAIINGSDCTATEIAMLSELLHLTREKRDYIFLSESVN
jgi:plasmid maintenance system antidote protein VapI